MKAFIFLLLFWPALAAAAGGELNHTQYGHEDDSDASTTTGNEYSATGDMLVTHDENILNDLDVYGNAVCHNNDRVMGNQTVDGTSTVRGAFAVGGGATIAGQTILGGSVCRGGVNGGQPCTSAGDCPFGYDPRPGFPYTDSSFCDAATNPSALANGDIQAYRELHAGGSIAGDGTAVIGASPAYSGTTQLGNGVLLAQACANNANTAPTILMQRSRGLCDAPTGPADLTVLGLWDLQGYASVGSSICSGGPNNGVTCTNTSECPGGGGCILFGAYSSAAQAIVEACEGATGWGSLGYCTRWRLRAIAKRTATVVDVVRTTDDARAQFPRGAVVCKTATPTPSVTSTAATPTMPATTQTPTPTAISTVGLKDSCPETQVESLDVVNGITLNGGVAVCQQNGVNCPPTFTATPTTSPTPTITVTATLPVPLEIGGASPTATPTATSTAATPTPTGVTPTPTAIWTPTVEVNGAGLLSRNDYYLTEDRSHIIRVLGRNNGGVGNIKQNGQDLTIGAGDSGPGTSGFVSGGTLGLESGGSSGGHSNYARLRIVSTNLNVAKVFAEGTFHSSVGIGAGAPTVASCGTTPSIVGTNNSFKVTVGNPNASTGCVVTWGSSQTFANAPNCGCNYDTATTIGILTVQPTTTAVTITNDALGTGIAAAFSTGAIFRCSCTFFE